MGERAVTGPALASHLGLSQMLLDLQLLRGKLRVLESFRKGKQKPYRLEFLGFLKALV